MQYSLYCTLIALLLECKRGCIDKSGCQKRNINHKKTALKNSRINFYFVTCFYSLYDICMADGIRRPN